MATILDISDASFRELGEPADVSIPVISFWYQNNIGQLNNLLDTEYTFDEVTFDFVPNLTDLEADIFKKLFEIHYVSRQIRKFTGAGAYDIDQVLEFKEGNRSTKIANKNDTAKTLLAFRKDLNAELQKMVHAYRFNLADARQTIIQDISDIENSNDGYYRNGIRDDYY